MSEELRNAELRKLTDEMPMNSAQPEPDAGIVERVARAIRNAIEQNGRSLFIDEYKKDTELEINGYINITTVAKAAIAAMKAST